MQKQPILKAIDRLKQLAENIIESQETITALTSLGAPKFEISNDIQTARSIMCAFAGEFQKQELQIMRLVSEWRMDTFPQQYKNTKKKPVAHQYNPLKGNGSAYELMRA